MSGPIIAVYSLKGGVGKTTVAVNLAWAAARLSGKRALLWDLDAQAASTWILGHDAQRPAAARAVRKDGDAVKLVRPTAVEGLDLLPADASLRDLDLIFRDLDKKKRLAKIAGDLAETYDTVIIDCPPGLTDTSEQVLRAADLVVVPVIPSPLSHRALEAIVAHIGEAKGMRAPLLPIYSMVDRRRRLHREALAAQQDWPVMPMASIVEAMAERRAPLGAFAPRSPAARAAADIWTRVEREMGGRNHPTAS